MPKIERLRQNTPDWHRWRLEGIGASDAPVIMGEGIFKTPKQLWSIKTRRATESVAGWPARRGRELERAARRAYERKFEIQMEPLCLVHERLDWMRASLDGLSFDGSIVLEIKCPLNLRDRNAAAQGRVPSHYYSQLQHQLEVSGAEEAHYWSFDGRVGCLVKIRPDRDHMKRLVDAEGEFWRRVEKNHWPELDDGDLDLTANPQWRSLAVQYRKVRTQFEKLGSEERRLRALLDRLATSRRTFGCGVEVLKSFRRGAVDYAPVPELRGVDLERYRKASIPVMNVNFFELSADSV